MSVPGYIRDRLERERQERSIRQQEAECFEAGRNHPFNQPPETDHYELRASHAPACCVSEAADAWQQQGDAEEWWMAMERWS